MMMPMMMMMMMPLDSLPGSGALSLRTCLGLRQLCVHVPCVLAVWGMRRSGTRSTSSLARATSTRASS